MHYAGRLIPLACAWLAWGGIASAAPPATKVETQRSQSPGGAATTASVDSGGGDGRGSPVDNTQVDSTSLETRLGTRGGNRIWSIAGGLETHVAFVQTEPDDARARPDKLYNYFFLTPQVFITPKDQVRADLGMYEHFTADPGESGLRLTDFSATYTRYIPLFTGKDDVIPSAPPSRGVLLRLAGSFTVPTSYTSQLRGLLSVPRLRIYAERAFFDNSLFLAANFFGEGYIQRYRNSAGAGPNAISRYSAQVTADYVFPLHKRLSFGALLASSWSNYYAVQSAGSTPYGAVGDPQFTSQPTLQIYSAELDAVYALPTFKGVRSSIALTYSLGDNTVLHDGVQHLYFLYYRRSTELYATLTARY